MTPENIVYLRKIINNILICGQCKGWDGYDAKPINITCTELTMEFLKTLPDSVQNPRLIPERDGYLAMFWKKPSEDFCLILSINESSKIRVSVYNFVSKKEMITDAHPLCLAVLNTEGIADYRLDIVKAIEKWEGRPFS